jgi:hypothetical protein
MRQLERLKWMAVPIAAYLVITLVLPIANGAAGRTDFAHHAMWVLLGCSLVIGSIAVIGGAIELAAAGARRLVHPRVNNRMPRRVSDPGGKS